MKRIIADPLLDETENIDTAITQMRGLGVLTGTGECNHTLIESLRSTVREHFEVPWTSITPPMERMLYAIAAVNQPRNIVAIGIFCGNTLVWNIGAACGPGRCYSAERLVGVEIESKSAVLARVNLERIGVLDAVELLAEDGHNTLARADYPIDLLYLDANGALPGTTGPSTKKIYLTLLQRAYDKMPPGSLVIAHDTLPDWFVRSAGEYLDFVRNPAHFRESLSVEPDKVGIEVSVK
jgi:predicted O-methyltransferase YrrM